MERLDRLMERLARSAADLQQVGRELYELGRTMGKIEGKREARDQLFAALDVADDDPPPHTAPDGRQTRVPINPSPSPRPPAPPRGYYAEAVRGALRTLASDGKRGVKPDDVLRHVRELPDGALVDIGHVRTALKVLTKQREAARLARGLYTAGPRLTSGAEHNLFVQ